MRISQVKPIEVSGIQSATSSLFSDWARMVRLTFIVMAISLLFLAIRCHAQAADSDADTQPAMSQAPGALGSAADAGPGADAQNVRVVRLSDVEGTVQIVRNSQTEFSHAVMNMPLTEGTRIETGPDGRAEIEFEDGSVTRITPNSSLSLTKLSSSSTGTLQSILDQPTGLVYYELRSDPRSTFIVSFNDNKVTPAVNSTFRVIAGSSPAQLSVIDGRVQVLSNNGPATDVPQNKTIDFRASGSAPYTIADGIIPNGFDQWNDQLDEQAAKEAANKTPARTQQGGGSMLEGGFGWGDLDAYGGWYPVPGYGMVWQPNGIDAGFDPYGYGSWANVGGFGVTWISGYPWGWLPYQCGGWSYIGSFGWGWMPGGCGFGGGWGIGFGYYGGYHGGGRYWHHHPGGGRPGWGRGTARIYTAPGNYHVPVAPTSLRSGMNGGHPGGNIVHVGAPGMVNRGFASNGHPENRSRTIEFNGTKIQPLHNVPSGANISMRNAALVNSAPTRSFQGGGRSQAFAGRGPNGMGAANNGVSGANNVRGPSSQMRTASFNNSRAANAAAFQNGNNFGQHATFGSHGSMHTNSASFNNGGGLHGGAAGGFHGASSSGFHGASSSGFHGASAGGGSHAASSSGGGGFHGGGGGGSMGGGGGHSSGGGGGGGGGHH